MEGRGAHPVPQQDDGSPKGPWPFGSTEPYEPSWSLRESMMVLWTIIVAGPVVIAMIALGLIPVPSDQGSPFFWVVVAVIYYGVPVVAIAGLGRGKKGGVLRAAGFRPTDLALAVGGPVLALVVVTALNTVYSAFAVALGFHLPESSLQVTQQLVESVQGGPLRAALTVLLVVIVAPLVEEAVFRGVVLDGLRRRMGPGAAIAISAIVFSAVHVDAWRAIPLAVMGAVLGYLAYLSRSVWPAVFAHALVNGFAYVVALLSTTR